MYDTHTPAEWVHFLSLAVAAYGVYAVVWLLLVASQPSDFDPRPVLRQFRRSAWFRNACAWLAALLLLLAPAATASKEATR